MNLMDLMFVVAAISITFGVSLAVGQRSGWIRGLVAVPFTLSAVLALYALFYWSLRFLPYRLGGPSRRKSRASDSTHAS